MPAGLAAQPPVPARPEQLRFAPFRFALPRAEDHRHRLSNGIQVFVAEDPALPLVDVALALPVGDFLDPPAKVGLASLTAAMLRRGGSERHAADAFDEAVDYLGAELDTSASGARSGVSLSCTTAVLDEALALMTEMVRRPRFQADRLAQAKANLRQSMKGRGDDPLRLLDREWRRLISGPDHYETRELTPGSLARIDRADLEEFHRRHWHAGGLVVAVSGDVSTAEILRRLEELLGDWRPDPGHPRAPPRAERRPAPPGLYHLEAPTPQVKVALGHLGTRRRSWDDAEAWALMVMREVLAGDGTISRLRSRLRAEAHLVYRVRSHFGIGLHGRGQFQVFFEAEGAGVAPAVEAVVQELRRLGRERAGEVELALAQRNLVDAFPLLFDSAEKIAGRFAEDVLLGRPHSYWRSYRPRIAGVSAREVQRAARRFLAPDELRVVVVGPASAIALARLEQLLPGKLVPLPRRDPLTLEPVG